MNINNAMKLLGLMTILTIASVTTNAYAALVTPTVINSITVNANDSIDVVCTDPTFDAGETIQGRELLIDDDSLFGSPEVTVGGPVDLLALTCDGSTVNNVSFVPNYSDFDTINVKLTVYDDATINSSATSTFDVADNTKPTVNAPVTPSTELTNADTFDENTCTVTDNDPLYGTQSCIITGSIDTSILGFHTVDFDGANDAAGNTPDTVTTSITIIDTTAPVLTRDQANPITLEQNVDPVPTLTATVSDNDNTVDGDTVSCDTSSVDNTILGPYTATCDFTDPSGNSAVQVTYDITVVDTATPTVTLSTTATDPTGFSPIPMTAQFSETVTGFDDTDITVGNGVVGNFVAVDGDTYTFDVTPGGKGQVTVDIGVGVAIDGSANGNLAATQFTIQFDDTIPSLVLSSSIQGATRETSIPITATFSQDVTGFVMGDISSTNAVIDSFVAVSPSVYTFTVHPLNEGDVMVQVSADVAQNALLVQNSQSNVLGVTFYIPRSDSCFGDCYHPHFGVDQNGKTFYDDGLMIDNLTYKIDNVLHNPYSALYLNVGEPVAFKMKAMDNFAGQIRHMELALSIPKGDFDKQKAQVIIDLNLGWDGINTISYEGDKTLVKDVSSDVSKTDKIVTWTLKLTPTQKLDHDMFAISVVDQYQYVGTYYINEGIKITGISQNGVPEFDYLDSLGYNHHLTIMDTTLEDLSVAVDEQGHKWTLDSKTQFWMKEFIRPDMKCSVSSSGYSRNCVLEFNEAKLVEQKIATEKFDSSKLQKKIADSSTILPGGYGRLHDPVPNMSKAYADYALSRAGHS